jgi:hypothetical protein
MNREWETQIGKIIQDSVRELELLKISKQEKQELKMAKARDIKDILLPKLLYVQELYKKNNPKGDSVYTQEQVNISDSEFEIKLVMPTMSEVNNMDLLFKIGFNDKNDALLLVYNKYSTDKMEFVSSADKNFEKFIEESITRFILNWSKRKLGEEVAKDRTLKLKIHSEAIY